jgi:hypothetical protein
MTAAAIISTVPGDRQELLTLTAQCRSLSWKRSFNGLDLMGPAKFAITGEDGKARENVRSRTMAQ